MKTLLVLAMLTGGCFNETEPNHQALPDVDVATPTHLPSDGRYVEYFAPYSSPENCLETAENIYTCPHSLALCANGRAGLRAFDLVSEGTYFMTGSIAQITLTQGTYTLPLMQFDVDTVQELGTTSAMWIVDAHELYKTLQFDNVSCE